MKELRCPHCGKTFQVDEADYEGIVSQVRNSEFEQELEHRLANDKAEALTIKNLAKDNPTMMAKFEEARAAAALPEPELQ